MVEAPPYKPCAPSFFILLWWSESAGTSFCGFPDLKKRRKCKKRLPGLPPGSFFLYPPSPLGRPAPRAARACYNQAELRTRKWFATPSGKARPRVPAHACYNQAELRTRQRFASALAPAKPNLERKKGLQACKEDTPNVPRTLAPARPNLERKKGLQGARKARPACRERLLRPSRTWNEKKFCKRASLRLFFRRRFL